MIKHVLLCGPAEPNEIFREPHSISLPRGLGGKPVNLLARALAGQNIRVTVVSTSQHVSHVWSHIEGLITMVIVPMRPSAKSRVLDLFSREISELASVIKAIDADIIHAHWTYEFALAALKIKKPLLVTAHDAPLRILRFMPDIYRLIRYLMAMKVRISAPEINFVTHYLKDKWRKEMFYRRPSRVIPNISPFEVKNRIDALDSRRVLAVGDGGKLKNIRKLVMAWPNVLEKFPDAQLELVGRDLALGNDLAKWATEKNIQNSIIWHGYLDADSISKLMSQVDMMVQPSLEESFGLTILEAMAHGLPVIGGIYSGGVPQVIGNDGLLVDVRNSKQISRAILTLLEDPNLCKEMGKRGRDKVINQYAPATIALQYVDYYDEIIARWTGRGRHDLSKYKKK